MTTTTTTAAKMMFIATSCDNISVNSVSFLLFLLPSKKRDLTKLPSILIFFSASHCWCDVIVTAYMCVCACVFIHSPTYCSYSFWLATWASRKRIHIPLMILFPFFHFSRLWHCYIWRFVLCEFVSWISQELVDFHTFKSMLDFIHWIR